MKLTRMLTLAALLLSGAAQVQAGDPIPGVDVNLPNGGNRAATSAISDQAQTGVSTSYGKGTNGGAVAPGPA